MARDWIFVPVIVQVLLTLLVYVRLIKVKILEMRAGRVNLERRGLHHMADGRLFMRDVKALAQLADLYGDGRPPPRPLV